MQRGEELEKKVMGRFCKLLPLQQKRVLDMMEDLEQVQEVLQGIAGGTAPSIQ